jgi:hypothetical protein
VLQRAGARGGTRLAEAVRGALSGGGGLYVFEIFPIKTQLTYDMTYSAHLEVFAAPVWRRCDPTCAGVVPFAMRTATVSVKRGGFKDYTTEGCAICDANRRCAGATLCSPERAVYEQPPGISCPDCCFDPERSLLVKGGLA